MDSLLCIVIEFMMGLLSLCARRAQAFIPMIKGVAFRLGSARRVPKGLPHVDVVGELHGSP